MSHAPAKGTSYNPLMTVSPTHIIRATVGVGFKRGRLRYAYQILRGRDLKTKETTPETRAENFATFGRALDLVLDLNNWHAFINTLAEAAMSVPTRWGRAMRSCSVMRFTLSGATSSVWSRWLCAGSCGAGISPQP